MTPYKYTYVLSDVELGTHFRVDFTLRAPRNGNLALSSRRGDQDSGIIYEIIIGGYVNSKSAIRRCKLCDKGQIEVSTVGIVSDSEDRAFWIEYSDGDVSVGRGEAPPMINQTWSEAEQGERPSTVYLGVSTWRDASGHWIFQNCS
ncbi:uncharacterized protein LOC110987011 [Acanthaster planci]|uniref:Uncharacterized protein LOC110987011 n=1 Tax=Acanthaster planci TaxID=133434 RepID=A0A8B7ZJM3_ACAPL|nr:uncharacterized protein LOC110987011 [Acanthaster planci]